MNLHERAASFIALAAAATEGPWVRSGHGWQVLTGDSWNSICVLHERSGNVSRDLRLAKHEKGRQPTDCEANSALIAAAPDMAALIAEMDARIRELEAFQDDAFAAHPNLDLDTDVSCWEP